MSLTAILATVLPLIDKLIPDKGAAAEAKLKLLDMEQRGDFKIIDAGLEAGRQQSEVNKAEAAHGSTFVAGWRPFIGWVCGTSLAYTFVAQPLITFLCVLSGLDFDPTKLPELNTSELMTVLMGMLGLGGLRTYEKFKGVEGARTPEKKK